MGISNMNEEVKIDEKMDRVPHLERYDLAFKSLLSQVFSGKVLLSPSDEFLKNYYRKADGDEEPVIELPAISIFPQPSYVISDVNNFPSYQIGHRFQDKIKKYNTDTNEYSGNSNLMTKNMQALYIDIEYEISIWANVRSEALQVVQELLFWLVQQQEVKIRYFDEEFIFSFERPQGFEDETDYTRISQGKLYNYSLNCKVHACIYRSKNYFNTIKNINIIKEESNYDT